jgi:acyl-coenzyme A synthetase/AMP-(fatty) acid ligase
MSAPGDVLLWRPDAAGAPLTRTEFLRAAGTVAAQLPHHRHAINLCESREQFLVAFAACLLAHRPQLMPSGRSPLAVAELAAEYPDTHVITDDDVARWRASGVEAPRASAPHAAGSAAALPLPGDERLVLTGFTSGSTGRPQAHGKRAPALRSSATLNSAAIRAALGIGAAAPVSIVGTVPPHHMYGIELTVLLPLFAGMSIDAERPLFPADVAAALARTAPPRLLVSTPLHLRALAEAELEFPAIGLIVSATAPLDAELARRIESRLRAPLLEMFGSTETCVIATRRTVLEQEWKLHDGVTLEPQPDSTRVAAAWFAQDQQLQDVLEPRPAGRFVLRGRNADLVEVAGKRASLADITRRICAIAGVEDAVAFQPEAAAGAANRVAAVVVSRHATARQIATELAAGLDAVFVPRPLVLVDRIPRDPLGKVSRARLLELARSQPAADQPP